MIQDIDKIKKEIKNHIEIDILFPLKPGTNVKYITLKDNEESFYIGGLFVRKGNEKIFLSQSGKTWAVPTKIRDNNNFVLYNSRFFIHKDNLKKTEIKKKEDKELEKIIESQQQVINKMTAQIIKYQKDINKKNERIKKLETYIKANMKN
tara:strand:- start:1615 stop:2064 length:450 start_codon:yes stop_codon:yes gene_type:complete